VVLQPELRVGDARYHRPLPASIHELILQHRANPPRFLYSTEITNRRDLVGMIVRLVVRAISLQLRVLPIATRMLAILFVTL
jgi:hypothetical protein